MRIVTIDMETFWDTDYTLSKMTPLEYVMDPRFELISCAIKFDHHPTDVLFGDEIQRAFAKIDWSDKMVIGHNMSGFDCYIMAYRLGIRPKMWGCTLAMARPIHQLTTGLGLAKLVAHYADQLQAMGISSVKNNAVLLQTKGRRLADFTPAEIDAMRTYNGDDDDQCWGLFKILSAHFTAQELWQIDALIRLRTEPAFELDFPMLEAALCMERDRKRAALHDLGRQLQLEDMPWGDEAAVIERVRAELASAPKFSAVLQKLGVEVPMKPSPKDATKLIPALAKNDEAFLALLEDPNELVANAARMRLDVKSTLTETRIEAFKKAGGLAGGRLPLPIKYCGAVVSGRDSGEEYNPQNMPRIGKKPRPSDALRNSLRAPDGYAVIVADQSGIELRVSHTLSMVSESMRLYADNPRADLYRAFGATRYNCPPEEVNGDRRQACKVAQLQLQFGSGAKTYLHKARVDGGLTEMQLPEAQSVVDGWRAKYQEICGMWSECQRALTKIVRGEESPLDPWGHMVTCREGIRLRSGRLIRYPHLRYLDERSVIQEFFKGERPDDEAQVLDKVGWWYGLGRERRRLYGAKVFQNGVQALARDSIFDCGVSFYRQTGLRFNLRTHDEMGYVVPEKQAQSLLDKLQATLRTPPRWWPELVVWSEGGIAKRYGEAK